MRPLTRRQEEIIALMAEGFTSEEIAGRLFVADKTVKAHKAGINKRLLTRNATHAVAVWLHMTIPKQRPLTLDDLERVTDWLRGILAEEQVTLPQLTYADLKAGLEASRE